MDTSQLARRLWEFHVWLDAQEDLATERELREGPPYGRAWLTRDAHSSSPAASLNRNRIALCGADGGLNASGLSELVASYRDRHIPKVFVWLSPGPGLEQVRDWLLALGAQRVPWTRYPTLLFGAEVPEPRATRFDIRPVGMAAFTAARASLGEAVFDGFARTIGKEGFHHLVAYDGSSPIAAAALVRYGDLGYLTYAATVEPQRRRGAQTELIAARLRLARALGCTTIVSQTLTLLADSFANLRRAGFVEVFEQEVFALDLY